MASPREPTLKRPLWIVLVGGAVTHAVVGTSLDTLCGLSPETAKPSKAKGKKTCPKCNARLREARALAKEESKKTHYTWEKQHPVFTLDDWKYQVANDDTLLGYNEWIEYEIEVRKGTDDEIVAEPPGVTIKNIEELAEHVGASEPNERSIEHRIYKDTDCGAWFKYSPPLNESYGSVLVGTIIEGSNVEPIVAPRRLFFPFKSGEFDAAIEGIERDAEVCWKHVNECPEGCVGDSCGYTSHAWCDEVEINKIPLETEEDDCEP